MNQLIFYSCNNLTTENLIIMYSLQDDFKFVSLFFFVLLQELVSPDQIFANSERPKVGRTLVIISV